MIRKTQHLSIGTIGLTCLALVATSCSDEMYQNEENSRRRTTIVAELAEDMTTRSCVDESTLNEDFVNLLWESTDSLGAFGSTTSNSLFLTCDNGISSARFSGEINEGDKPEYVYYPYTPANNGRSADATLTGTLSLKQSYWQSYPGVDNDWRIGTPTETDGVFHFTHLFSMVHFNVSAAGTDLAGEKLESITLTVTREGSSAPQLAGDFSFTLKDGFTGFTSTQTGANSIEMVWRDRPVLDNKIYHGFITCAPTVKKGDNITIEVKSTRHVATFTRQSLGDFQANHIYTVPLTLSKYAGKGLEVKERTDVDAESLYHPCLILRDEDLARIQRRIREVPALAALHRHIISLSESYLNTEPVINNATSTQRWEDENHNSLCELAASRIMALAYAYRTTLDKRYADRAIKEMMARTTSGDDWDAYQFLDAAEMVTGMAYGYDWLYDVMTDTQRQAVRDAMYDKMINVTSFTSNKYTDTSNQNSIWHAGAITAGLVLREAGSKYQSRFNTLLNSLATNNSKVLATYSNGNYPEGPAYWGYGTDYQVLLFQALEDVLGEDSYSYLSTYREGFFKSARYIQMTVGSSGLTYNYSDCNRTRIVDMAPFWFAYKANDNSLAFANIEELNNCAKNNWASSSFTDQFPVPMISLASRVSFSSINDPGINSMVFNSSDEMQPLYLYRGGWRSPDDVYLGVKGGRANNAHAHMDAGSFVYDRFGERWAFDLGGQSYQIFQQYHKDDLWKYSNGSYRWQIFRYNNKAHNTLTVNNAEHRSQSNTGKSYTAGLATITSVLNETARKGAVIDMTKALSYPTNSCVSKATRTIYVDGNDDLHVEDAITAGTSQAAVTWTMVTDATATVSGNSITLTKNGKTMVLTGSSTVALTPFNINCKGTEVWDVDNGNMRRVGFKATISTGKNATISVTLKGQ